jgi:acyl-CoA thioesterase-1
MELKFYTAVRFWLSLAAAGVLLAAALPACGAEAHVAVQQKDAKATGTQGVADGSGKKAEKEDPVLAGIEDAPGLSRVLLIGDSISMGYTLPVRDSLRGKANVHRPAENCGPTTRGVEKLDGWLGDGPWDIIHFNFGLHDLKYVDGKPQVSLEDYEKNLRTIVKRLKQTGAKLIWCTTTPVPKKSSPARHNEDVLAYNAAAKKVMEENGIAIDDLYAFAEPQIEKLQRRDNVHFTRKGYEALATQVSKEILDALKDGKSSDGAK